MEEYPFENLLNVVSQAHCELIPLALREWFEKTGEKAAERDLVAADRLLQRVRAWEVDDQLRIWLHTRASLRSYRALHLAMEYLFHRLAKANTGDQAARQLAAEIVGCPTVSNIARLALRGLVHP